ncbi:unnamed protein product [Withania somnifera]
MEEVKEETQLPPGFRFHPTDEELITYYLVNKINDASFTGRAIADVDLNKSEPWDLPGKAKMEGKEWYFFSLRDRKYPTGVRTNRATNSGYWKTTGKDKEIFNSKNNSELVGMKKTLVFYKGRAPRGEKTNWVMHEYRIRSKSSYRTNKPDEWVVCRIFQKSLGLKKYPMNINHSRAATPNPYSLNINQNASISSQMMIQLPHDHQGFQFAMGRSNYMNHGEIQELNNNNRVLFQSVSSNLNNFPLQPQMSYNIGGGSASIGVEGGGRDNNYFSISGLNLNLGHGAIAMSQPILRPLAPPPPPPQVMSQQEMASSMMANCAITSHEGGYGGEMNGANTMSSAVMAMDHCSDLDNYWTTY